jgi:low density lipoprotein receptor-related protein 5/6
MKKGRLMPLNRVLGSVAFLVFSLAQVAVAQTIVWTDANARKIQRKDVSGGQVATIVQFPSPQAASLIDYDPITAKLYYRITGISTPFQRANLDGSDPEGIPTPSSGPFTLNVELRRLYWGTCFTIYRSDLNGMWVESHTYADGCLYPRLAVGDDLYLGSSSSLPKGIWRANADGSNEQLLHTGGAPTDAAYDPIENKLYVATGDDIYRLNPDGSGFESVIPTSQNRYMEYAVVDSRGRRLYWTNTVARAIQRSNLDGSNVQDFVTAIDVGNPNFELRGLTIVYNSSPIPAVSGCGLMTTAALLLGLGLVVLRKRPGMRADAR